MTTEDYISILLVTSLLSAILNTAIKKFFKKLISKNVKFHTNALTSTVHCTIYQLKHLYIHGLFNTICMWISDKLTYFHHLIFFLIMLIFHYIKVPAILSFHPFMHTIIFIFYSSLLVSYPLCIFFIYFYYHTYPSHPLVFCHQCWPRNSMLVDVILCFVVCHIYFIIWMPHYLCLKSPKFEFWQQCWRSPWWWLESYDSKHVWFFVMSCWTN